MRSVITLSLRQSGSDPGGCSARARHRPPSLDVLCVVSAGVQRCGDLRVSLQIHGTDEDAVGSAFAWLEDEQDEEPADSGKEVAVPGAAG